jgi:pyridoxamine 5'-phosphate oxidase
MKVTMVFSEKTADPDPFRQFDSWYRAHLSCGIPYPDAFNLGTAAADGTVSVRTLLLKGWDDNGFLFFTSYLSKKGLHISENPHAAMHFFWYESGRQVRIEGIIEKISEEDSLAYFQSRPRESQLSALASDQSQVIPDRAFLADKVENYRRMFESLEVPKPSSWGGFRLVPKWFEFWQEGDHRLHDRVFFSYVENRWISGRLAP